MAKYLWVGMGATSGSGTNIVDQYCFNKSGNWYSQQVINGTLKWAATSATPSIGDAVIFGTDPSGSGSNLGWTAAKSPCLFGGFSGGVGAGVWANTGVTATVGTTFTSPLTTITVYGVQSGYKFPYLGGGISGDIATWCAARDGVTAGYYTTANSSGFRDPTQNLRLKWSSNAYINNTATYLSSEADGITNPANYSYTYKFDLSLVGPTNQVGLGDTVNVKIMISPSTLPQILSYVATTFAWDKTKLEFMGIDKTGARAATMSSLDWVCPTCVNEASIPKDGTGFHNFLNQLGDKTPVAAPSLIVTLKFRVIADFSETTIEVINKTDPRVAGLNILDDTGIAGGGIGKITNAVIKGSLIIGTP